MSTTEVGPISVSPGLPGGISAVLGVTAPAVVKNGPGILARVLVVAPGTSGNLTLNDAASTGGASASNEILTIPFGSLAAGQTIPLEWPCAAGIVVSSVPTGGSFSVSFT